MRTIVQVLLQWENSTEEARAELVELSSFLRCFIAITKLYIMNP